MKILEKISNAMHIDSKEKALDVIYIQVLISTISAFISVAAWVVEVLKK